MSTKLALRKTLLTQREQLEATEVQADSLKISEHCIQSQEFTHSQHISIYLAVRNEVDTQAIINAATELHKIIYLPVIHPQRGNQLAFYPYQPGDPLTVNRFGIAEPETAGQTAMMPWELQLIILPVVGFDHRGYRLGHGAGHYDRSLAFVNEMPNATRPALLGLAYDWQEVDQLPTDAWDVPMDGIITPAKHHRPYA